MNIKIDLLHRKDAEELYKFEIINRAYFEKTVPGRGDDYYNFENFKAKLGALLEEQEEGRSYFYLIRDEKEQIFGRINLTDIEDGTGHIGYRVGESHIGKGVAKIAVDLLLCKAAKHGVKQILAKTTTNNIASQKVLENNHFKLVEANNEEYNLNGETLFFVNYMWVNQEYMSPEANN